MRTGSEEQSRQSKAWFGAQESILGPPAKGSLLRRISTKLVVAVLLAVVLPFGAFALFLEGQMANRLTRNVVQESLLGLATDLSRQVDAFLLARAQDLELLATEPVWFEAVDEHELEQSLLQMAQEANREAVLRRPPWDSLALSTWARRSQAERGEPFEGAELLAPARARASARLDALCQVRKVYDRVLLVGKRGRLITSSALHPAIGILMPEELDGVFESDYSQEAWFESAMDGRAVAINHHVSPWRVSYVGDDVDAATGYQLGFALPVERGGRVVAVLYALVNWSHVQELVSKPVVENSFRGLVEEGEDPSPYAWIWDEDADTILAHPNRELYYRSIVDDVGLGQMTDAVVNDEDGSGLYPEYEFGGVEKNAAFHRTLPHDQGGFDWVVGVGIDNRDIYRIPNELRRLLLSGTALVLLMAVVWTFLIARRISSPILELQSLTRRVAEGDLTARAQIHSRDEVGALARDLNAMTSELENQRERIIAAEKDAAWKEMARQIAHDIKNPLTPIQLSLDLLRRVRREDPDRSESILERTLDLVDRQVGSLKRIAAEFYEFTGGRRPRPESIDLPALVNEVLHLHDAWAVELGVEVQRDYGSEACVVWADRDKLNRVLVNLTTNALQAMPDGGTLQIRTRLLGERCSVEVRDTGSGVPKEAQAHLFEPYFTTKSEGTGLGLAISKRVIEEMDGSISLRSAEEGDLDEGGHRWGSGGGTVARVELPRATHESEV
ncbi:MAG: signal transduction histidine kinase [Planctomycetota bacterium]|jgi:signal transduction histidine kinase